MPDIQPEPIYELYELMIDQSNLLPDIRFEEVKLTLKVDDLIALFLYSIDESLNYEMSTLILNNKPLSEKMLTERARADDRLERMCDILQAVGIKKDIFLQYLWLKKNAILDKVNEINETLIQADIDSNNI